MEFSVRLALLEMNRTSSDNGYHILFNILCKKKIYSTLSLHILQIGQIPRSTEKKKFGKFAPALNSH